jgi:hypothetical protein
VADDFKETFLNYLPAWYKRQQEAMKLADSYGKNLQDLWDLLRAIRHVHSHIMTSSLDWWGRDFQVYRQVAEDDDTYRERILSAIRPKKLTTEAILSAVRAHYLGRGYTEGTHYSLELDEYQKLSFRVIVRFFIEEINPNPDLVAKVIKETRAAGIYGKLFIGGNQYTVDAREPGGFLTMNDPFRGLNGDFFLGPNFDWTPPVSDVLWGGILSTNGVGALNSTYTMGNTYYIDRDA